MCFESKSEAAMRARRAALHWAWHGKSVRIMTPEMFAAHCRQRATFARSILGTYRLIALAEWAENNL